MTGTLSVAVGMLRDHMAAEPDRDAYPYDDGHAQAAYWAAYDEWAQASFGLRMMVGGMLIREALNDL
ncbi:hypothetical protein ACFV9C_25270 [Kribbella sp. NPDC059898]|uniref:hypothetical protein n=1 Tax=Kribbella sp. NPDC059898 TaxID=3346995 RepID=UPI00365FED9B